MQVAVRSCICFLHVGDVSPYKSCKSILPIAEHTGRTRPKPDENLLVAPGLLVHGPFTHGHSEKQQNGAMSRCVSCQAKFATFTTQPFYALPELDIVSVVLMGQLAQAHRAQSDPVRLILIGSY